MDFNAALDELNTTLGDSANITFSADEKTRALTKAWNDPFVVTDGWDDSLTYTQGTYQYSSPFDAVEDIFLTGGTAPGDPISNDLWDLVVGNIQFNQRADNIIPTGSTLYVKGRSKFAITDTLDAVNLQEYVLALAGYNTLTLLSHKKANLFVKNDVTMSELLALRRELLTDVKEARARLPKHYESA